VQNGEQGPSSFEFRSEELFVEVRQYVFQEILTLGFPARLEVLQRRPARATRTSMASPAAIVVAGPGTPGRHISNRNRATVRNVST
jgi:hypothetical protein